MVRKSFWEDDAPAVQEILDSLDDPACRTLIRRLTEPMTARELSDAADVPLSTTYRKLEQLNDASLLATQMKLRQDGHHQTMYHTAFEEVSIWLDENREFDVSIVRPPAQPEEQLASMWAEMRRGT
ncbi:MULTISPECIES: helix-turn-helix domain-containing protein [unclassified Haladaptatus]|uniref:winged helix-turn-helix domain-containing protein n=1 Tax=unclassified Haladaptatus TaxID=2622732 RepID=UPI0023E8F14A|nr:MULTISPECIES: helix-turn-helix domain-containing protein [unclassified Haladaptatus]